MDPIVTNEPSSPCLNKTIPVDNTLTRIYNEDLSASSLYDSALENITNGSAVNSMNGSLFYDTPSADKSEKSPNHNSTFMANKLNSGMFNDSKNDILNMNEIIDKEDRNPLDNSTTNATALFIQSESTDSTQSSSIEEVDPKSLLANKTIFKSDNPNLSIVEINDNSIKEEEELTNSVVVIEDLSDSDENTLNLKGKNKSTILTITNDMDSSSTCNNILSDKGLPPTVTSSTPSNKNVEITSSNKNNMIDERNKRAKTLVHASKQKLDIEVAEAFAAKEGKADQENESAQQEGMEYLPSTTNSYPATKREIKIYDTLDEFEENLPSTVTILDTPFGSRVYLVGTAHFSEESQDDVSNIIRNVRPDVVLVELCPSRIHILKLDEKTLLEEAKSFNLTKIREIVQAHGYINGIFFILMLQMSAQIAKDLGMAPGGEFRRAFAEIHRLPGCMLQLGDRPIRITLHRALRALSLWQTCKLVWRLTSTEKISIEEVEECKNRDLLEKLMEEMAGEFPAFADVFVKERDLFLCHSLQLAALPQTSAGSNVTRPVRVVGVVGIGHAKGIAEMWGSVDPRKIPEIMEIPPASLSTRIAKYTLKYGLIGLTIYGAYKIFRPRLGRLF